MIFIYVPRFGRHSDPSPSPETHIQEVTPAIMEKLTEESFKNLIIKKCQIPQEQSLGMLDRV